MFMQKDSNQAPPEYKSIGTPLQQAARYKIIVKGKTIPVTGRGGP
jgi:hypothetical protein